MSDSPASANPQLSPLVKQALDASAKNDTEAALSLFLRAIKEEPASAIPQFLMAAELAQLGRIAEAEAAYAAAVLLAPGFDIARFELGVLQFTSARAAIALLTWQPLLALQDSDPLKLFVQGYAALAQDAWDDALRYFEAGIVANQVNPPLNGNIRLLINAILRQRGTQDEAPPNETDANIDSETETEQMHFLLSHYKNQGLLN